MVLYGLEMKGTQLPPPPALTSWHQDIGQDGQASQDEGKGLGEASPHKSHGEDGDQLGWDVHSPKDELDHIDVEVKILQVHGQPIVGKAGGEPRPRRGRGSGGGKCHLWRGVEWDVGVTHHPLAGGDPARRSVSLSGVRVGQETSVDSPAP